VRRRSRLVPIDSLRRRWSMHRLIVHFLDSVDIRVVAGPAVIARNAGAITAELIMLVRIPPRTRNSAGEYCTAHCGRVLLGVNACGICPAAASYFGVDGRVVRAVDPLPPLFHSRLGQQVAGRKSPAQRPFAQICGRRRSNLTPDVVRECMYKSN